MSEKHLLVALVAKFLGPKSLLASLVFFLIFWQVQPSEGPAWKDVAIGALGLVSTLASVAFLLFLNKIKEIKLTAAAESKKIADSLEAENLKRDKQHRNNLAVLVAIVQAIKTGDPGNLDTAELFRD